MPPSDIGVATSSATFFRQIGGTLGTAVFLSVLFSTVGGKIASAFKSAATTPAFQQALVTVKAKPTSGDRTLLNLLSGQGSGSALNDTSFLSNANQTLAHPFYLGFSSSMHIVFAIGLGVLVLAFISILFLREVPLRTQSGLQARQEQEQAAAAAAALPGETGADEPGTNGTGSNGTGTERQRLAQLRQRQRSWRERQRQWQRQRLARAAARAGVGGGSTPALTGPSLSTEKRQDKHKDKDSGARHAMRAGPHCVNS